MTYDQQPGDLFREVAQRRVRVPVTSGRGVHAYPCERRRRRHRHLLAVSTHVGMVVGMLQPP